jgi:hypothetical protein
MEAPRPYVRWILRPVVAPGRPVAYAFEKPDGVNLLERLRREAELQSIGRTRFVGTLAQRNRLWLAYRNYLRQAISNFRAALTVDNRSASLLYYYAMLNFAKAELLRVRPAAVQGFVAHGLSFNGTNARTIGGDSLTVRDGVFRILYEQRTGYTLPPNARLPVKRLLSNIPEIADQVDALTPVKSSVAGVLQLIAVDNATAWPLLAVTVDAGLEENTASGRYFRRVFRRVDTPRNWRDHFGVSRRWGGFDFYESITRFPFNPGDDQGMTNAVNQAADHTWSVKDLLGLTTDSVLDAHLAPSLYRTRMLPMPPSIARYAMAFYASSLVRYRPAMFDTQVFPDQAYLFDALARESAVPMLIDTIAALTDTDLVFVPQGLRL